ncbi:MAG: 50S ribosomal protein L27 [Candidatus Spechtbacteria bacterium RIFCSPLOWO2_01_FULL_43_12]|uniref:Large ribosomal subunit protein bL27 n=1 Tax=Candidatus Spechtbacteria bacterium RIFCSPLOWO2_01_FULL_43_12 TaxID=1802162 RepID=A0A1G2HFA0_9BACT|nr:MAG: 50S ribosomal protein L27 [Candidatus Spechtbacteria bacterium RIFCSPLOWO2_01_FULL_43_12]
MAKTKAAGSTKLGRDSVSKRLGIKLFGGQKVKAGMVIARQRGTKFIPGKNVRKGGDDTLYAARNGLIKFHQKRKTNFDGKQRKVKVIDVL